MATKAKENCVIGKEKKEQRKPISQMTSIKRTTKPSITATTTTNSTIKPKPNPSPSERNKPNNYLKPTSKQPNSDSANNKSAVIRRRSLDQKPNSSSNLPRSLTTPHRSSIGQVNKSSIPSKPISDRTSKAPSVGKTKPLVTKGTKKTSPTNVPTPTSTKKVATNKDHASVISKKRVPEVTRKTSSKVEIEQVKEVTSQQYEVIKVENEEHKVLHEVEHVTDISPVVESEDEIEHVQGVVMNSDPHHDEVDEERVISTVSEAEKESLEEKANDNEEHGLEEGETNEDHESDDHQENHSMNEGEVVAVVNDGGEGEGGVVIIEDHMSEDNNNEEEANEEKKEGAEEVVKDNKVEATTPSKPQLGERKHGKMEAQVSNDEIEKTASMLLEARKNKVRALAGAFQTVIDHQST